MDELNFDSPEPIEIPVSIGGKKYVLREASEASAKKYEDYFVTRTRYNEEGKVAGLGEVSGGKALLVSLCLWEMKELNGTLQRFPVNETTVLNWPSRIVGPIFEKAKEISGINQESEEALARRIERDQKKLTSMRAKKGPEESPEKNSPEPGTGTSASPTS